MQNNKQQNNNTSKDGYYAALTGIHRAVPIILTAVAVFIAICFITGGTGLAGEGLVSVLKGLFSYGAFAIPVMIILHSVFYAEDVAKKRILTRAIFSLITVLVVSAIEYTICYWGEPIEFAPVLHYTEQMNGGFVGTVLAFGIVTVIGHVGLIILAVSVLALYLAFFFANSDSTFGRFTLAILSAMANFFAVIEKAIKGIFTKMKDARAEKKQRERERKSDELLDDSFFDSDNGMSELKIRELGISNRKDNNTVEQNPTLQSKVHIRSKVDYLESDDEDESSFSVVSSVPAEQTAAPRKREFSLDYGIDVAPDANASEAFETHEDKSANRRDAYGIDASADSVFNSSFDPFDFEQAQKAATKASTKAPAPRANAGIGHMTGSVSSLPSYDEYESMRKREAEELARKERLAEFDRRKRAILEKQRAADEARLANAAQSEPASTVSEPIVETTPAAPTIAEVEETPAVEAVSAPVAESVPEAPIPETVSTENLPEYERPLHLSYDSEDIREIVKMVTKPQTAQVEETVEETVEESAQEQIPDPIENHPENETDEEIARRIAERIAMKNPAYARSANDLHIITQVIGEEKPAEETALEESAAEEQSAETEAAPAPEEIVFELGDTPSEEDNSDVFEFITDDDEPDTEISKYSSTVETDDDTDAQFKEFDDATETLLPLENSNEDELVLERTMLSPAPDTDDSDIFGEIAEDDSENEDSAPEDETEDEPEAEPEETSEDFMWTEDESEDGDGEEDSDVIEEGTVFTFEDDEETGADNDEDEDEDDDSAEIFGTNDDDDSDGEDADAELVEIPPEEQNPDVIKQRELFPFLDAENSAEEEAKEETQTPTDAMAEPADEEACEQPAEEAPVVLEAPADEPIAEDEPAAEDDTDDAPPFDDAFVAAVPAKKSAEPAPEPKAPEKPDYSNYEFPSIDLLGLDRESSDENVQYEIQENADRLIDTLASFNVTASIKGVDRGPRITRYEVVPAKGVKVSSIMNLQDDIALSLAADGIRMEAPIPGKSAVGVEIPNKKSATVRLRELLETEDFVNMKSKTAICIGKDVAGQPVINDISKMPHLLIAGATGMGKSVCINSLLISILYKAKPDEVKLIMIDPKQVEFTMYNGIPHLLIPVVSDAKQAAGALMWAVDEMERRYNLLNPLCVRNVDAYNEKVSQDPSLGEPMSKIVIVIDEFADLMLQVKDPVENLVMRIAQKARAAGIHLIIGTQRPSTNVITGTIKANIPSRISCKVASNVDSRTVLDAVGAEKLLNKGDMLFAYAGAIKPLRVQGAFVADGEVEAVMAHLKQYSNGASYDEAVMEEIKKAADKCSKKGSGGGDADEGGSESSGEGYLNDRQFLDAVDIAVNSGRLSTALLQRKLSIGYGKAARFIDVMCDMGIISEPNGQKPREVLITADEWHEKLSRTMIDD
ncbi:MAG: hypothetical protein IJW03_00350 [Clostridia bacterium]|nr:hypothetical protein [Clostridia bacterium]